MFNKLKVIVPFPLVLFACFFIFGSVTITNDTAQYLAMHIHRDPLYCLFLLLFRIGRGPVRVEDMSDFYFRVVVLVQNILAFLSVVYVTAVIRDTYRLKRVYTWIVSLFFISPHIITPLVSHSGMIMSNTIMSEAITIPLFYFFVGAIIRMVESTDNNKWVLPLVLAFLLSLARGQMMVMIIVWIIVRMVQIIMGKRECARRIVIAMLAFVFAFGLRGVGVKTYNLIFNNHFMGTTFSEVSLLANILYVADDDMADYIEDSKAREFFMESMKLVDEKRINYKYQDSGLMNAAGCLDVMHDEIKFKCIDECWRPLHDLESDLLKNDYELETAEQDRVAGIIIKAIWPRCFARWFKNYIGLCIYGFIRTVAIVNSIFNWYALVLYLFWITATVVMIKKSGVLFGTPLVRLSLITGLITCANVCGTATVIMCLSRYMIYVLPLVYTVVAMLVAGCLGLQISTGE